MNSLLKYAGCLILCGQVAAADSQVAARSAIPATVEIEVSAAPEREIAVLADSSADPNEDTTSGSAADIFRLSLDFGTLSQVRGQTGPSFRSGTIVSTDGLIVTHGLSMHAANSDIVVRLDSDRTLSARVVVDDQRSGLQLLKVEGVDLPTVSLSVDPLAVGQDIAGVVTVSGYRGTLMEGIVSGRRRTVKSDRTYPPMIQTDLRAGAGSAGSPIVNTDGQLIGIVAIVAGLRNGGGGGAVTFAVPAKFVQELLEARKNDERITISRGYLGVELDSTPGSPIIRVVREGSPAAESDLQAGDRFTHIAGARVYSAADVLSRIAEWAGGHEVPLKLRRGAHEIAVRATLAQRPVQELADVHVMPQATAVTPPSLTLDWSQDPQASLPPEAIAKLRRFGVPARLGGIPSADSTIRLERSNVEEKIEQLSVTIRQLEKQISRLADAADGGQDSTSSDRPR